MTEVSAFQTYADVYADLNGTRPNKLAARAFRHMTDREQQEHLHQLIEDLANMRENEELIARFGNPER